MLASDMFFLTPSLTFIILLEEIDVDLTLCKWISHKAMEFTLISFKDMVSIRESVRKIMLLITFFLSNKA